MRFRGKEQRFSPRTLRRTPGFTVIAVLVMGLGIGANVALCTVVREVLLKPLPFRDPDRLVTLYEWGLPLAANEVIITIRCTP